MGSEMHSDAFSVVFGGKINFSNWPIYTFQAFKQLANDCTLFSMKFMEHYDGEKNTIRYNIVPENASQYRFNELFYVLFHRLNESHILLEQLEKFRLASK